MKFKTNEIKLLSVRSKTLGTLLSFFNFKYKIIEKYFSRDTSIAFTYYSIKYNSRSLELREFHREGDFLNRGLIELSNVVCQIKNKNFINSELYFLNGSYGTALGHISLISSIVKDHIIHGIQEPRFRFNLDFFDKLSILDTDIRDFYLTFLIIIEEKFNGKAFILQSEWPRKSILNESAYPSYGVWNLPTIENGTLSIFQAMALINQKWEGAFLELDDFYRIQQLKPLHSNLSKPSIGISIRTDYYHEDNRINSELRSPNLAKYEIALSKFQNNYELIELGVTREPSLNLDFSISAKRNFIPILEQIYLASNCEVLLLTHNGMADILGEFNYPNILCDDSPTNQIWHHKALLVLKKRVRHKNLKLEHLSGNLKYVKDIPGGAWIEENSVYQISSALTAALTKK